jgi:HEPN domain-containing protein
MNAENSVIFEWKRLADMDLATASHMFDTYRPIPLEVICFHSQQSAEKILKCFLVHNSIVPPKTHDLNKLLKLCSTIEENLDDLSKEANILTGYAVFPRYPANIELNDNDGRTAIDYAVKINDYVNELIFPLTEEEDGDSTS